MIGLPFLLASALMLAGLIGISFAVMRSEADQRRLSLRVNRVVSDSVIQVQEAPANWRDGLQKHKELLIKILNLFNIDTNRAPDYPIPWWVVLIAMALVTRAIVAILELFVNGPLILIWPLLFLFISRIVFNTFHRRRAGALFKQFPDALGTIVRCVRVGIPVQESLRIVSRDMPQPTAQEFSRLADKVTIGVSLESALQELAVRNQLAEYRFFATALSLQARTGGPLAQTLETLADVIRKRVAMRARGYALASEARTSALVLGVLPIFAGVAIWLLQPSYIDSLFISKSGHEIFGAAVGLLCFGAFVMRTIIQRSLS